MNLGRRVDLARQVLHLRARLNAAGEELHAAHREIARLKEQVEFWKAAADEREKQRRVLAQAHDRELLRLGEELDRRLVPMPCTPVPAGRDRENAIRLAEENARLRAELEKQLEGHPS